MSAKDQIKQIVDFFKREPYLKDKTDAMGDGLLLGANLADEANELSKETGASFKALQREYTENGNGAQTSAEINVARDGEQVLDDRLKRDFGNVNTQFAQTNYSLDNLKKQLSYNLADYARLDSELDDTGRFKRLVVDLEKNIKKIDYTGYYQGGYATFIYNTIFIPDGHYLISDEIRIDSEQLNIISFGDSLIEQTNPLKNIFNLINQHKVYMHKIKLVGGKHHVYLGNGNTGDSHFIFDKCNFKLSHDYAIKTHSTWDLFNHLSAHTTIRDCDFLGVHGVIDDVSDYLTIDGGWVNVGNGIEYNSVFNENRAVFVNRRGKMNLSNIMMNPMFGDDLVQPHIKNSRWIDNYESLKCYNVRFGGEQGGIPTVYQFGGELVDKMGSYIHLDKCQLFPFYQTEVIRLMYEVPYQISVTNCDYMLKASYIKVAEGFNIKSYLDNIPDKNKKYSIKIESNQEQEIEPYATRYPDELKPYVLNEETIYTNLFKVGYSGMIKVLRNNNVYTVYGSVNGSVIENNFVPIAQLPEQIRPKDLIQFPVVSGAINIGMGRISTSGEFSVFFKSVSESDFNFSVTV